MYWKLKEYQRTIDNARANLGEQDYGQQQQPQGYFQNAQATPPLIQTRGLGLGGLVQGLARRWWSGQQKGQLIQNFPKHFIEYSKLWKSYLDPYTKVSKTGKNPDAYVNSMRQVYNSMTTDWNQFYQMTKQRPDQYQQYDEQTKKLLKDTYNMIVQSAPKAITDPEGYRWRSRYGEREDGGRPRSPENRQQRKDTNDFSKTVTNIAQALSQSAGEKVSAQDILDAMATGNVFQAIKDAIMNMPNKQQAPAQQQTQGQPAIQPANKFSQVR